MLLQLYKAGIEYSRMCFVLKEQLYFHRWDYYFEVDSNIVNFPPSPSLTEKMKNSFFVYNIENKTAVRVSAELFHKKRREFLIIQEDPNELNAIYDLAIENELIRDFLFMSDLIK